MKDPRIAMEFPQDSSQWKNASATFTDESLQIFGHPVMEAWEKPYMKKIASIACSNGGKVLEVGFGMGISAGYIQQHKIEEHVIIEANAEVFTKLEEFAKIAKHPVNPLFGFWQDVVKSIPSNSFDGILFDTYPIKKDQIRKSRFEFFSTAYRLLKKKGVFTYFCSEIELTSFERQRLNEAGFNNMNGVLCQVNPPNNCLYWQSNVILAPTIIK